MQADCLTIARRIIVEGEGKKLKRYADTKGHATIGIGHKIKNGEGIGESITQEKVWSLFKKDLESAQTKALNEWGNIFHQISPNRQAVIIDMTFNMGSLGAWKKFRAALQNKNYSLAAKEIMNSDYAWQVGPRSNRNAAMMKYDGEYTKENFPQI